MAYQFTQTGAEIQDILDQVGTNTQDIGTLNTTLTQLINSLYYKSGDTISGTIPAYGFITGGAGTIDIYFSLPKLIPANATFTASSVGFGGFRTVDGGYIPTQPTVSQISILSETWGMVHLRAANSGTGVTNNTPITGTLSITMSVD